MSFKNLLERFTDNEIIKNLIKLYPEEEKSVRGYGFVLDEIRKARPKETDITIEVANVKDDGEEWVDISGRKEHDETRFGLDFTPWEEWLSMTVSQSSLINFSELDIVCHCLWEMTWEGWSQKQIRSKMKRLELSVKEVEEMEKNKKVTPL